MLKLLDDKPTKNTKYVILVDNMGRFYIESYPGTWTRKFRVHGYANTYQQAQKKY